MTPKKFVEKYLFHANRVQEDTGISALAILTQAAHESGWGKFAPGNMFFGVKDTDGLNGNEQLLLTSEYHRTPNVAYPEIISIEPVVRNGQKYFKYRIRDYFRKYPTPYESFRDHANFFKQNPRYQKALEVKENPEAFLMEVAKAGYATDPNYGFLLGNILITIKGVLPNDTK